MKKKLFIGITDFEAAFDLISRRNLFKKLIELGISMIMLRALVEMYRVNLTYVEINSEYSRTFLMTAGVLQGSATSTILFMAYTADLVKLFNDKFPVEDIIHLFHILLHADDCLILSECRKLFEEKFQCLGSYCDKNSIRLQPKKCSFLAINTNECEDIVLSNGVIKHTNEGLYLGSILSSKGDINHEVALEIQQRRKHFNKFFAFLRENYNAPFSVKEKVLEACVSSAVLHNCESWGNANVKFLELLYRKSLKYLLGVRTQVCNEFPYVELQKPTLASIILRRQYIFYMNCTVDKDWPLQRYIIRKALDVKCPYILHYIKLRENYSSGDEVTEKSLQKMKDSIMEKAMKEKSRYMSYVQLNPNLSRPEIYSRFIATYKLQKTSQLWMISHDLKVETGRHKRPVVPREERLCLCGAIETEEHFLLECTQYCHIRSKYNANEYTIESILNQNFICDYIHELFHCRKIFLDTRLTTGEDP